MFHDRAVITPLDPLVAIPMSP